MQRQKDIIEGAFEERASLTPQNVSQEIKSTVDEIIHHLDKGTARIAEKINGEWKTHEWLKKAVLLYFRTQENEVISAGFTQFYDKVPLKYQLDKQEDLIAGGVRIAPHAIARRGAYIAPNTILMPSYVNIGAYIGCERRGGPVCFGSAGYHIGVTRKDN